MTAQSIYRIPKTMSSINSKSLRSVTPKIKTTCETPNPTEHRHTHGERSDKVGEQFQNKRLWCVTAGKERPPPATTNNVRHPIKKPKRQTN